MRPTTTIKTFLVEDSAVIRDNLVATLEELAAVELLGDADEEQAALQALAALPGRVDLLIVDIFLKKGSGLGVLRGARPLLPPQAMVVVLSNYATPDMRRRCLDLGADRVFDKSNEIEALILFCRQLAAGAASAG
ncbi:response regulator [Roseateles violae]|uniref:Response regulator n=1 Tax=Roseateles violae TaxID=3058042 RepID=A0ABT8DLA1_9BURK|nr:response regulator [Pelomonas sp. PFR6]MDN3919196.1 response regulator [Pelomonas sp. PFR6]